MRTEWKIALATALLASVGCSLTIEPESVKPPASQSPGIQLSRASVSFVAPDTGPNPGAELVTVSNSGGGTLAAPTATISYVTAAQQGWLAASVSGTAAPYTIHLTATVGARPSGTYLANVSVASTGVASQTVAVTFTISSTTQPTMLLTPGSLSFDAVVGGVAPASKSVSVDNVGSGTLALPTVTGVPAWLTATPGGATAPFTIQVAASPAGLAAGTYTADVAVASTGASNSGITLHVTLTVAPATQPLIALTPPGPFTFSAFRGGTNPPAQTLTVSNVGTGSLTTPVLTAVYVPAGTAWLGSTVAPAGGGSFLVTLLPSLGSGATALPVGTYTATVQVAGGASNSPQFTVTLQVTAAAPALCIQSVGRKVCGGTFAAGGGDSLSSSTRAVRKSALEVGGAQLLQSPSRHAARSVVSPGATQP
jgi:hypothetical protein